MKVFVAGTMQGSNAGYDIHDQTYRARIQAIVRKHFPQCEIVCPYALMSERFSDQLIELARLHRSFSFESYFQPEALGAPLTEVIGAFREYVRMAAASDLLIAHLPDRVSSMGTAIEMWAAHSAGAKVVAITAMTQNLAILSVSTAVVSSIEGLDELLEGELFKAR